MMYDNRQYQEQVRKPYRNSTGGLAVGIFLIALAVAIFLGITWHFFLPVLFAGLAFATLLGGLSSYKHKSAYGGLQGFVWLMGLAFCFAFGFWPWILFTIGCSIILGALAAPVMGGLKKTLPPTYPPYRAPYQPGQPYRSDQPYQPYQQGYQPPQQETETSQEDEQQREYTQPPR